MFMVVSWAREIMNISKKAWTFPVRPYYYILFFLKINTKPNNSKTEGRKGHTGPLGQPRGEELTCRFTDFTGFSSRRLRRGHIGPRGSPRWGRAALQVPLLSHDLVTDWAHPGGSRQTIKSMTFYLCYLHAEHHEKAGELQVQLLKGPKLTDLNQIILHVKWRSEGKPISPIIPQRAHTAWKPSLRNPQDSKQNINRYTLHNCQWDRQNSTRGWAKG